MLKLSTLAVFALLFLNTACSSNQSVSQAVPNPTTQAEVKTSTLRLGFITNGKIKTPTGPTGWAMHQGKLLPELQQLGITEIKTVIGYSSLSPLSSLSFFPSHIEPQSGRKTTTHHI